MKKRYVALFCAMTLGLSLLTGCAEKGEKKDDLTETSSTDVSGTESGTTEGEEKPFGMFGDAEVVKSGVELAEFATLPYDSYVEMGEYKGLEVNTTKMVEVTEDMITEFSAQVFKNLIQQKDLGRKDGVVADGDDLNIDYVGKVDGVEFEGGKAEGAFLLIGSGKFIPGFEEGLIGKKVGETVDVNTTFPEEYPNSPDLAGKTAVFTVTINYAVPEMTDDKIAKIGEADYDNVADFKKYVATYLESKNEQEYQMGLQDDTLQAILPKFKVKQVPDILYNMQYEVVEKTIKSEAEGYGMEAKDYVPLAYGKEFETYAEEVSKEFAAQVVIFQAIANKEGIKIEEKEVDEFVSNYMEYNEIASEEELYEAIPRPSINLFLMQEKVIAFIIENAKITEK